MSQSARAKTSRWPIASGGTDGPPCAAAAAALSSREIFLITREGRREDRAQVQCPGWLARPLALSRLRPWEVDQTPQRHIRHTPVYVLCGAVAWATRRATARSVGANCGGTAASTRGPRAQHNGREGRRKGREPTVFDLQPTFEPTLLFVEKRVALAAVPDKLADALAGKAVGIVNPAFFTVSAIQTRVRVARATFKVDDVGW